MTDYPNREHANADKAARRRALKALDEIASEAALMKRRLEDGHNACADDTQTLVHSVSRLTENLSVLAILRDVREWHAADEAEATATEART